MPRAYWIPVPKRDHELILCKHTVLPRVTEWAGCCGMGGGHDLFIQDLCNVARSDIDGFQFDERAEFRTQ